MFIFIFWFSESSEFNKVKIAGYVSQESKTCIVETPGTCGVNMLLKITMINTGCPPKKEKTQTEQLKTEGEGLQ